MTGEHLALARRQDVDRRRTRVEQALVALMHSSEEITISGVARAARVHRSFLHRHLDLRAAVLAAAEQPANSLDHSGRVSRASLEADNLNLAHVNQRLRQHITSLEHRLSDLLGEQAYHRTGLGAPEDLMQLQQEATSLQHQVFELRRELSERDEELAAAREAHRRLMTDINR